ncbi:hypothetical protein PsYK624_104420 [Phanerochaete sordida]|uniref:Uncharacterized protein n=1 Tax=Phanerochaete sordida TaxID=48140 RepID=A0A9P3LGW5_9APHY|nr:hypothetical protein PsYK624_104420 [Phanerochaete sordida]
MFHSRRPSKPHDVYASELAALRPGWHPMWVPEPQDSGEIQIGDVDYFDHDVGAFHRLFNLDTAAPEKRVTRWTPAFKVPEPVPDGAFETYCRPRVYVPGRYCAHSVEIREGQVAGEVAVAGHASVGIAATSSCTQAHRAQLELKSNAEAEALHENSLLQQYILRNHPAWCTYAKKVLNLKVNPADIVVVAGFVKTKPDWAVTAFSSTHSASSAAVEGNAAGGAGGAMRRALSTSAVGPIVRREGKRYLDKKWNPGSNISKKDQCVFVKLYRVERRHFARTISAGSGPHQLPRWDDSRKPPGQEGVAVESHADYHLAMSETPFTEGPYNPLNVLSDYRFAIASINVSIAVDKDAWSNHKHGIPRAHGAAQVL